MVVAEGLSGFQSIVLGLALLCIAFVLRRGIVLRRRSKKRDISAEVHDEMRALEQSSSSLIRGREIRLYEYGREVEGRIETRIAQLDTLIEEADRKIDRLRFQLAQKQQSTATLSMNPGPDIVGGLSNVKVQPTTGAAGPVQIVAGHDLSFEQRRMIEHLQNAGYAIAEIARLLERSEEEVRAALDEDRLGQADAA